MAKLLGRSLVHCTILTGISPWSSGADVKYQAKPDRIAILPIVTGNPMRQPAGGPLTGLKVIEFGQIAAGPFAGSLLADLGADVVKVEKPGGGDDMRHWPPISKGDDGAQYSENFASVNRNKRSIAIDLKNPAQVERLRELCMRADAIIENFRPGVLDRLGLGYEDLSAASPRLVYCSINGYGHTG